MDPAPRHGAGYCSSRRRRLWCRLVQKKEVADLEPQLAPQSERPKAQGILAAGLRGSHSGGGHVPWLTVVPSADTHTEHHSQRVPLPPLPGRAWPVTSFFDPPLTKAMPKAGANFTSSVFYSLNGALSHQPPPNTEPPYRQTLKPDRFGPHSPTARMISVSCLST